MNNLTTNKNTVVFLFSSIRVVILFVVLCAWAIIGFLFWIPLLTRNTAVFSFGILYTMLTDNSRKQAESLRSQLDYSIAFYVEGFQRIFQTLYPDKPSSNSDQVSINSLPNINFKWNKFLAELAWTIAFWTIILIIIFLFGVILDKFI